MDDSLALAGDDKRRPRLVDEDGVNLIHDDEIVAALHHFLLVDGHVVAQIIEAELVVRAVGDIGGIGDTALPSAEIVDDQADGETEEAVYLAHPLRVTLGQIVVDRDNVDALAGQGIEVGRKQRNKRFAFAGLHFRNASLMQHDAADDLHAVGTHSQHAVRRLADGRKGLRKKVIQRFTGGQTIPELLRLCAELLVRELAVGILQRHDGVDGRLQLLDLTLGARAEYFCKQTHN